jgi:hypothetical protein
MNQYNKLGKKNRREGVRIEGEKKNGGGEN